MRIHGKVFEFDGNYDNQNEKFSKDCIVSVSLPLPVTLGDNTVVGRVLDTYREGEFFCAEVKIAEEYEELVTTLRKYVPNMGLAIKGYVSKDSQKWQYCTIEEVRMSGLILGVNFGILTEGFTIGPRDRSLLTKCEADCEHCSNPCVLREEAKETPEEEFELMLAYEEPMALGECRDPQFNRAYDEAYGTQPSLFTEEELHEKAEPGFLEVRPFPDATTPREGLEPWMEDLDRRITEACGDRYSYDDVLKLLVCLNMGE